MKTKLSIILLLAAILAGCAKDPVDNPDNPDNPVNVVMQDVALTGIVKDANGNPLGGVNVTTGTLNATTGSDGTFIFTQAGTVDSRAIIKFEKSGYFTLTRSGDKEDEMYMEPMMYRKGNDSITLQTTFDASSAKTLTIGGMKINLPASCFAKADGSAYSGTVHADVLNLGSGNANRALMMPGGDLACDKSGEIVMPFGMMDAIFTDNAGNLLKIKDKMNIPISFPAPPGATDASVPLWTFDEARGVWTEEGSATLQGNGYTGTVSHFTGHSAGNSYNFSTIRIHVTECDKPAAGAKVSMDAIKYKGFYFGITDGNGDFLWKLVFTDESYVVHANFNGQYQSTTFTADSIYGLQVIYFNFDDGCNSEYPEKLAVRVTSNDHPGGAFVTYDNFGLRVRTDTETGGEDNIEIDDYMNCHFYGYPLHTVDGRIIWMDYGDTDGCNADENDLRKNGGHLQTPLGEFLVVTDELTGDLSRNYTRQQPDEQLLGKTCKVYFSNDGGHTKYYIWNNIIMLRILGGTIADKVYAITENVPEAAFSKTLPHPWIQ